MSPCRLIFFGKKQASLYRWRKSPLTNFLVSLPSADTVGRHLVACAHNRAVALYIDSIRSLISLLKSDKNAVLGVEPHVLWWDIGAPAMVTSR